MSVVNMVGKRYGRVVVVSRAGSETGGGGTVATWNVRCDCGVVWVARGGNLRSGRTTQCRSCASTKHALNETPEYRVWAGMIQRCTNPHNDEYRNYGARGIAVDPIWRQDFAAFYTHLGARPTPQHTLDRIVNDRGYVPGNVRWATKKEEGQNRRANRVLDVAGERATLTQWSERHGVPVPTIRGRLRRGWPVERAVKQKARL